MRFLFCFIAVVLSTTISWSQIKTDSLVLYYPLNNSVQDSSGFMHHGTLFGPIASTDRFAQPFSCYYFDGIDDYIYVPDSSKMKPNFPFSISLWVKVDSFPNKVVGLFNSEENSNSYSGFWMSYSPNGQVNAGFGSAQGVSTSYRRTRHSSSYIDTNSWFHLAASFNQLNNVDIYIDGVLSNGNISGSAGYIGYTGVAGSIGRNAAASSTTYHKGSIDDVRIYTDGLSQKNVMYLATEGPCINTVNVYDTIPVFDSISVTVFDTLTVYQIDTIYMTVYDSIAVTDTLLIDVPLSIGSLNVINSIKVYPNPTHDWIFIDFGQYHQNMSNYSLEIINNLGQSVYSGGFSIPITSIHINDFGAKGTYYIRILDNIHQVIDQRKIILY